MFHVPGFIDGLFHQQGKKRAYHPLYVFEKTRVSCYELCEGDKSIKLQVFALGVGSRRGRLPLELYVHFKLVLSYTFIITIYYHFPSNKSFKQTVKSGITQQEFQNLIDFRTNIKTFSILFQGPKV